MLAHSLSKLSQSEFIEGIWVGLSPDEQECRSTIASLNKVVSIFDAGNERVNTVLNGLKAMLAQTESHDWVLVHDAARPLVSTSDIDNLVRKVIAANSVGGLLANRIVDTLKKSAAGDLSEQTLNRNDYWCAQTPQMFRLGQLRHIIEQAMEDQINITDEASAMEAAGYKPLLVEASAPNFKVTTANDLKLAELLLADNS